VKDMALKRYIRTEIVWNKKEASRGSPDMTDMRRPRSDNKDRPSSLCGASYCYTLTSYFN